MLLIDQKVSQIKHEIVQEQKIRMEQLNQLEQGLQEDFPKLQEQILASSLER